MIVTLDAPYRCMTISRSSCIGWRLKLKVTLQTPMASSHLDCPYAGLLQACDWLLADQAKNGGLLAGTIKALESTEKKVLDCIDWAELAGNCGLPKLSAICIEHLIQDDVVSSQVL